MISKLRVLTHLSPEKSEWGYLEFRKGSPIIILESGEVVLSTTPDVYFDLEHQVIVDESGLSMIKPLKKRASILLNPILEAKFPYAPGFAHAEEPYYPPSTLGWLGRARFGVKDFSYVVQRRNDNGLWLTIVDENGVIQESHRIRNHEFPILKMKDEIFFDHYFSECGCVYYKNTTNNKLKLEKIYEKNIRHHKHYPSIDKLIKQSLDFLSKVEYTLTGNFIDLRTGIIYISLIGI